MAKEKAAELEEFAQQGDDEDAVGDEAETRRARATEEAAESGEESPKRAKLSANVRFFDALYFLGVICMWLSVWCVESGGGKEENGVSVNQSNLSQCHAPLCWL